eukprot:XP_008657504.1 actin cytoskeleton-regulatory complex protein pan1-like [Zea mays]
MGRGARALRRHFFRIRHHHHRRLCQTDRLHRGGSGSSSRNGSSSNNDSGHPASKATGRASPSSAPVDAPPMPAAMPTGGSGSQQYTSAGNVVGDPLVATTASSASAPSPPSVAVEEVPVAFASTMRGDAGAEVAPSAPQDPPVTVEATPLGPQVPTRGPEVAMPPTATADLTAAIPLNTPSAVGMGARPSLSHRQLWRIRRSFLGDCSGLASNLKQR